MTNWHTDHDYNGQLLRDNVNDDLLTLVAKATDHCHSDLSRVQKFVPFNVKRYIFAH